MMPTGLRRAFAAAGLVALPPAALYKSYHDPLLVAWNWSFMPLDIAFSLAGLAIAFWTLTSDFDMGWWLPNLVLLLGPLIWLPGLIRSVA